MDIFFRNCLLWHKMSFSVYDITYWKYVCIIKRVSFCATRILTTQGIKPVSGSRDKNPLHVIYQKHPTKTAKNNIKERGKIKSSPGLPHIIQLFPCEKRPVQPGGQHPLTPDHPRRLNANWIRSTDYLLISIRRGRIRKVQKFRPGNWRSDVAPQITGTLFQIPMHIKNTLGEGLTLAAALEGPWPSRERQPGESGRNTAGWGIRLGCNIFEKKKKTRMEKMYTCIIYTAPSVVVKRIGVVNWGCGFLLIN